ncbi:multidrug resistance-associated protein 1 [Striga asiatica]|uniref:Multidrug resistance-associated protein 1 n=1 Tax=Striga asiatica TaxID=4170 RepID=A0A5A7PQP1_STRAF|nr:multidrug resistance-associated protein 1 [Striga asiatica]
MLLNVRHTLKLGRRSPRFGRLDPAPPHRRRDAEGGDTPETTPEMSGEMKLTGCYTGIRVNRIPEIQESLLVEEDSDSLKITPYNEAGLFNLITLSWLNPYIPYI